MIEHFSKVSTYSLTISVSIKQPDTSHLVFYNLHSPLTILFFFIRAKSIHERNNGDIRNWAAAWWQGCVLARARSCPAYSAERWNPRQRSGKSALPFVCTVAKVSIVWGLTKIITVAGGSTIAKVGTINTRKTFADDFLRNSCLELNTDRRKMNFVSQPPPIACHVTTVFFLVSKTVASAIANAARHAGKEETRLGRPHD